MKLKTFNKVCTATKLYVINYDTTADVYESFLVDYCKCEGDNVARLVALMNAGAEVKFVSVWTPCEGALSISTVTE